MPLYGRQGQDSSRRRQIARRRKKILSSGKRLSARPESLSDLLAGDTIDVCVDGEDYSRCHVDAESILDKRVKDYT